MTKLSVNVNKIATLRNSRGGNNPNLGKDSEDILKFGAHGLTVHPRPDGRHIRPNDVIELSKIVESWNKAFHRSDKDPIEFNIEGYPNQHYFKILDEVQFHQATLVPDPPEAITSNAGWRVQENLALLKDVTEKIQKKYGARVSIFIDTLTWTESETEALLQTGADRVELYTESYAKSYNTPQMTPVLQQFKMIGESLFAKGLGINAGHDLDHLNLGPLTQALPVLSEVSIGHAIISQSLYWGLEKTIQTYLKELGHGHSSTQSSFG